MGERIDLTGYPKNDKGAYIVPDAFFDEHYKELPSGTLNESKSKRAFNNGYVNVLNSTDTSIQSMGGKALQAKLRQRRTFAEATDIILGKKANKADIEAFELPEDAQNIDVIIAAMKRAALEGNVRASEFLRANVGEAPVTKQEIQADIMTDADRQVIANALKRLKGQGHDLDATK